MKRIKKFISFLFIIPLCLFFGINIVSCSYSNKIYFGNFESYMSNDVMKELSNEYNISFKSYKTNEQLEREFKLNYDISIGSTYAIANLIKEGNIEKIDWSKFEIELPGIGPIENANDALNLFTPEIHPILKKTIDINGNDLYDEEDNLLNYSIPYFFQDFILGYKEEKIDFFNETYTEWKDVFKDIKDNNKNMNKVISIDDYRTLFSLGKLIENSDNNVNPEENEIDVEEFQKNYEFLPNNFTKNKIIFNSDSGIVLNDLANPRGSDVGIMYNGDVLYAMQGGDSEYEENINFVRPTSGSNIALDLIVINKNSKIEKDILYNVINDLSLKGSTDIILDDVDSFENTILYNNFDFVQYTTPIKNLYDYVIDDKDGYFSFEEDEYKRNKLIEVFKINPINPINKIENYIKDIQKSNMLLAYLFTKSLL